MTQSPRPLNAWKHGGYSNLGVLPGEDPKQFDDFHLSVIDEWKPSGTTECDTVLSLARCMWRKSRLHIYGTAASARREWESLYEKNGDSAKAVKRDSAKAVNRMMLATASKKIQRVVKKFEEGRRKGEDEKQLFKEFVANYKEYREWVETNKNEIQRGFLVLEFGVLAEQVTPEALIEELELDALLDSKIDRLIKRLLHLKAAKQMIQAEVGSPTVSQPPPRLASSAT